MEQGRWWDNDEDEGWRPDPNDMAVSVLLGVWCLVVMVWGMVDGGWWMGFGLTKGSEGH
jgi:uncharacterized ion transporter superfamily protein YfcC